MATEVEGVPVAVEFALNPKHDLGPIRLGEEADDADDADGEWKTSTVVIPRCLRAWVDTQADDLTDEIIQTATEAFDAINIVVTRLMDCLRAGQPWNGLTGRPAELTDVSLTVLETGAVLDATRRLQTGGTSIVVGGPHLTTAEADAAVHGSPPEPYETLLADARNLVHFARHPSPALGVLLAAVATETRAKAVLRGAATDENLALLELILGNERAFPASALDLFGGVSRAALGHSLRDDDRDLWKRVDALFQARNRVAHRADLLDLDAARGHVRSALDAARWLEANARPSASDGELAAL